jgi:phosphatidate cytidylyltransferase
VGLGVIWEWWGLASKIAKTPFGAAVWLAAGVSYVGVAMAVLVHARAQGLTAAIFPIALVIAVDIGAYFAGRTFGGPKIAPSISPSKTWSGILGGTVAAGACWLGFIKIVDDPSFPSEWPLVGLAIGLVVAIIAQAGDFFESWMKRRAGVKDSGTLIPGHGGLFDRVDGLLAVLLTFGLVSLRAPF